MNLRKLAILVVLTSVIAVGVVHAVTILGTIEGGPINVSYVKGQVFYSTMNEESAEWSSALDIGMGYEWYCRMEIEPGGYVGNVAMYWNVERWVVDLEAWSSHNVITIGGFSLTGEAQIVYASSNGLIEGNTNFADHIFRIGNYKVVVYIKLEE